MKNEKNIFDEKLLKSVSIKRISEKESIRTTFNLGEKILKMIDKINKEDGITPKKLFDYLTTIDSVIEMVSPLMESHDGVIFSNSKRKTYVISKDAKRKLEILSEKLNISRDRIVELLVFIYYSLTEHIKEEEKEKEIKALKILKEFAEKVYEVEAMINDIFKEEKDADEYSCPIPWKFGYVVVMLEKVIEAIEDKHENGTPIEPYD